MNTIIFRWHYLALVALMTLVVDSAQAQHPSAPRVSKVIKGENDSRDYRYITLSNNLRVLLISDNAIEKSAAALNVHAGSHQNPSTRPGLAHFLEHMLFLGSEKYPVAGEYQEFISQHGGDNNAYTSGENTSYYFDIENSYLEPALDRFAQFFTAPTFDANYVEHEKSAINAEYLAKINDDERRDWDVYRSLFNPANPASIFAPGNQETLADPEGRNVRNIRDDLMAFYQNYYSANLMSLVVIGNRRLDDLQKMVETRFTLIPNRNKIITNDYPELLVPGMLPASISIKPQKELRELSLVFPVPNYSANYQTKPLGFLAHLLGSESSGGLLAFLKNLGWAESVSAGELFSSRREGLFQISITLTKDGVKAKDQIVSAVFDYLKIVSARGITEWRFNELKQIAELDYRYHEKQTSIDTVVELSQAMHDYPARDVLWGKYAYTDFDDDLIEDALSFLRKDNVLVTFVAPEAKTVATTAYYQVPYGYVKGIPEVLDLKPLYRQKLFLPERNVFIPKNTSIKTPSMLPVQDDQAAKNIPTLLLNGEQLRLWFLQDMVFRSPKAELYLRFKLPIMNNSLDNSAKVQLVTALIRDQLNEYAYAARLAGLTFRLEGNSRGIDLNVTGYTDKQSLLVSKIVDAIAQPAFTPSRFENIKENLLRQWRNEDKDLPYSVLAKKIPRLQYTPYWSAREYADALQKTPVDQFKLFANEFLRGAKIEALFYGNLYPQDAIKLAALIEHQLLQKQSVRLPQSAKILRAENKDNKSWLYVYPLAHNDHAAELYIQALSPSADDAAHMLLLGKILQAPFYNQLRTEKQLGYIVSVIPLAIKNMEASVFTVQSPTVGSETLIAEVNTFLANAFPYVSENFVSSKNALLAQLREVPGSLNEQAEKYWQSILLNDTEFSRQQDLANAVNKITLDSLRKYYELAVLQKNRRLWLATDSIQNLKDFDVIGNIAEYQQKQQGYISP